MPQYTTGIPFLFGIAAASLATGYYLGQTIPKLTPTVPKKPSSKTVKVEDIDGDGEEDEDEEESDYEIDSTNLNNMPGEVRMALVIRQDLKMEKGKIAAQCAHAALSCYRLITNPNKQSYNAELCNRWLNHGQAKITLKCPNKEVMDELYAMALSLGVNATVIHDAGRTQIAAGSTTVLGLGPAPKSVLDQITGDLKLY
ncbi:hypothetical protein KAFR_0L01650 [Kazachstania africana CBS 2517]|uniref:peptidyl-tRNA hydrolase n=1 Tax=Kazachstania africana (strain ATCC 22294 / BCRC 22015 / CBS 2517 / CECT 1963 / NBRC 1671 / NRRL Y-8276) TaxID=1071382 RepID=H2B2C5_KAZAF|nr:hypothetical protein KAFR_0L01650 [Kazachstania africana CBS 2517]CCF60775.1 hypothetical protein KAFR_0L01650 [Kazachstania africana CBS 2517]